MTDPSAPLPLLIAFLAGALLAALTVFLWARARESRRMAADARRLAEAEVTARAESARRSESETRLAEVSAARDELDRSLASARTQLEALNGRLAEQQQFIEQSRTDLQNAFKALAGAALEGNTKQFLELAQQRFEKTEAAARGELEKRKQAIEELLAPLRETLGKLETRTGELEVKREGAYAKLLERLQGLSELTSSLQAQTTSLATALRGSQVRGRWGEIALRNVAELAGMTEHCDFEEQETVEGGGRPDMTVRLPGGRFIAVDAKAPLAAYLEAVDAGADETAREAALDRHVKALRSHIRLLAARDYPGALAGAVDLTVLFLPGDPFLAAAFGRDPDLQVEALRSRVLVATPTTLVALLRTVAIYWQQQALAENAETIAATARDLYDRAAIFGEHLGRVGKGLSTAVDAYNDAVGSFEHRLMPMGRRLQELKAADPGGRKLNSLESLGDAPRELPARDRSDGGDVGQG